MSASGARKDRITCYGKQKAAGYCGRKNGVLFRGKEEAGVGGGKDG